MILIFEGMFLKEIPWFWFTWNEKETIRGNICKMLLTLYFVFLCVVLRCGCLARLAIPIVGVWVTRILWVSTTNFVCLVMIIGFYLAFSISPWFFDHFPSVFPCILEDFPWRLMFKDVCHDRGCYATNCPISFTFLNILHLHLNFPTLRNLNLLLCTWNYKCME
jgi:hypothetical protein